jgi:DNA-binding NarL/FixJ family response regulator
MSDSAAEQAKIRVLVADDHPVVALGLSAIIDAQPDMLVAGRASTAREAIELHARLRPDVTLMDLRMPDISGFEAIADIRAQTPDARIVVLTTYDRDEDIHRALQAGASSYVLKATSTDALLAAIRRAHMGDRWLPAEVEERLKDREAFQELTRRERDVLRALEKGLTNRDVASLLGMSENTVKYHLRGLFTKLGVADRTEAVSLAMRRGLLDE